MITAKLSKQKKTTKTKTHDCNYPNKTKINSKSCKKANNKQKQ